MKTVTIKVAGESIQARVGETVIHALWNAGKAELIKTGCAGGVCGACTITVRSPEGKMKGTDLACMCPVEEGMEVFPCPVDSALTVGPEINPNEEKLRKAYPMSIPVMDSVLRMRAGQLDEVADDFTNCIHCGLCRFVCEDGVEPHMMGMWVRRSIGSSAEIEEKKKDKDSREIELEWQYLLEGSSTDRMNNALQFRKSGKIQP